MTASDEVVGEQIQLKCSLWRISQFVYFFTCLLWGLGVAKQTAILKELEQEQFAHLNCNNISLSGFFSFLIIICGNYGSPHLNKSTAQLYKNSDTSVLCFSVYLL